MTATVLLALLLVAMFALWLTLHLALCARLLGVLRPRALFGLLLFPPTCALAGYFGLKFGHKRLVVAWGSCAVAYVALWLTLPFSH